MAWSKMSSSEKSTVTASHRDDGTHAHRGKRENQTSSGWNKWLPIRKISEDKAAAIMEERKRVEEIRSAGISDLTQFAASEECGRQRIVVCLIGFSAQHCERRRARRPVRTAADSDGRGSDCQGPWARSASGRRGGCWPCARTAGVWARAPRRARRDGRCRRRNTRAAEAAEPSLRVRLEGTRWPRGHAVDQEYSYPKRLSG